MTAAEKVLSTRAILNLTIQVSFSVLLEHDFSDLHGKAYQGSERILSDDRIPEPREDWEGIVTRVGAAVASAVTASVLEVTKTMFDQKRPRQSRPIDGDTPFKRARKR
tara:strand:- start:346 stop:669 length:324 start_codon:yes stop_codon:yes gene_type:complete